MSLFIPWKYISEEDISKLEATVDQLEVKSILKKVFRIRFSDVRKQKIAVDFLFYCYAFCKERGFTGVKSSTFLSLANDIWLRDTSDSSSQRLTSFEYFKKELFRHAIDDSPRCIKVFEEDEVEFILNYVTDSYYRHFSLFKYIFTPLTRTVLKQTCINEVEIPRRDMLPLNEAFHVRAVASVEESSVAISNH